MKLEQNVEVNGLLANIWASLADPRRIRLIYLLAEVPRTASELGETLEMSQPSVSRLLADMRRQNIVTAQRQGTALLYSLSDPRLMEALELLRAVLHDDLSRRARLMAWMN
jgi:DNA-binding transcriptional ArsR family regulator